MYSNTSPLHSQRLATQEVGDSQSLHQTYVVQGTAVLQQAEGAQNVSGLNLRKADDNDK